MKKNGSRRWVRQTEIPTVPRKTGAACAPLPRAAASVVRRHPRARTSPSGAGSRDSSHCGTKPEYGLSIRPGVLATPRNGRTPVCGRPPTNVPAAAAVRERTVAGVVWSSNGAPYRPSPTPLTTPRVTGCVFSILYTVRGVCGCARGLRVCSLQCGWPDNCIRLCSSAEHARDPRGGLSTVAQRSATTMRFR